MEILQPPKLDRRSVEGQQYIVYHAPVVVRRSYTASRIDDYQHPLQDASDNSGVECVSRSIRCVRVGRSK